MQTFAYLLQRFLNLIEGRAKVGRVCKKTGDRKKALILGRTGDLVNERRSVRSVLNVIHQSIGYLKNLSKDLSGFAERIEYS